MPAKIKNIIYIVVAVILLLAISQSLLGLLGNIELQTPCTTNTKYNRHYNSKGIHVLYHKRYESNNTQSQIVNYNHYPQINVQTNSSYVPLEESQSVNVGTFATNYLPFRKYNNRAKYKSFGQPIGPTNDATIHKTTFYTTLDKTQSVYASAKYHTFGIPMNGSTNDAIMQTNSLHIPFEEPRPANIRARHNAFGPPMDGYDAPINGAILPLLIFSFIYLVLQLKLVWRNKTSGQ